MWDDVYTIANFARKARMVWGGIYTIADFSAFRAMMYDGVYAIGIFLPKIRQNTGKFIHYRRLFASNHGKVWESVYTIGELGPISRKV